MRGWLRQAGVLLASFLIVEFTWITNSCECSGGVFIKRAETGFVTTPKNISVTNPPIEIELFEATNDFGKIRVGQIESMSRFYGCFPRADDQVPRKSKIWEFIEVCASGGCIDLSID